MVSGRLMETAPNGLRPLPLRIAGSIGVVASVFYLGGVLGQDDTRFLPQAIFWFLVMLAGGIVAWYADRSMRHGRRMAVGAAMAFFALGLFSNVVFATVFVVAVVLTVGGFAATSRDDAGSERE